MFHFNLTIKDEAQTTLFKDPAYWSRDAQTGLTFNNCVLCPHCIYMFCTYLRKNSDLCHLQHKLIGFYNRDENCLLRYRAVNNFHPGYKTQSVYAVSGTSRCYCSDKYKTYKYSVGRGHNY